MPVDTRSMGGRRRRMRTLTRNNIHDWKRDLQAVEYSARWDPEIMDIEGALGVSHTWDGVEEKEPKVQNGRRDAYDVTRMRVSADLQYLIEHLRPGDAHGVYVQLSKRYSQMTTGAISALTTLTNNITMISTGLSIKPYAYHLKTHHGRLMFVTGRKEDVVTDAEAIGIFLKGLLSPEYDVIRVYLSLQKDNTRAYIDVLETVVSYAQDQGILDMKKGNPKVLLLHNNKHNEDRPTKNLCRFFARGKCTKGKDCNFSHSKDNKDAPKKDISQKALAMRVGLFLI